MEKELSIIGSIASIGSAIWAWLEARKSSQAASRAEKVKDEIIHRREIVEVSQVHIETKRILQTVAKIGPASNSTQLIGVNGAIYAKEVEEYSRFLNEQSSHFTKSIENIARELCISLNNDIEALADAKTPEEIRTAGKNIYYKLNRFMPTAKDLADQKREKVIIDNI